MDKRPQPHHIDPNNASGTTPSEPCKVCNACQALLPLSAFGLLKYAKSGFRDICKECRSQEFRLYRKDAYNSKSNIDDSIVRNVKAHNTAILKVATDPSTYALEIRGFDTLTKVDYKVFFGPSNFNGMRSVALFDYNAQLYREFNYSGMDRNIHLTILDILHRLNIRLEYTEADSIASKATIYFI